MKASIAMAITLSSALLVAGCSDPAERRMKQAMESQLVDPASAQYNDVTVYNNGYVCGSVNAKNRMGGYTGFERFIFNDTRGSLIFSPAAREFGLRCRNESKEEFYGVEKDIRTIYSALKIYRLDNYVYPSSEQGLEALLSASSIRPQPRNFKAGGYAKADDLVDPWGRPYLFTSPGEHADVDILTLGADGKPGGEGENADTGNWMLGLGR